MIIDTLRQAADFARVLQTPSRARSVHFAIHHVARCPGLPPAAAKRRSVAVSHPCEPELSTGDASMVTLPVDDLIPDRVWLGLVVPKRHARRSVTRSLLKRRIRCAVAAAETLPPGLWVVRLRSPFAVTAFRSAASEALNTAAASELAALVASALRQRP